MGTGTNDTNAVPRQIKVLGIIFSCLAENVPVHYHQQPRET